MAQGKLLKPFGAPQAPQITHTCFSAGPSGAPQIWGADNAPNFSHINFFTADEGSGFQDGRRGAAPKAGVSRVYIQGLGKIIGTLPFLVLYLERPTRAAPIVGGFACFSNSDMVLDMVRGSRKTQKLGSFGCRSSSHASTNNLPFFQNQLGHALLINNN